MPGNFWELYHEVFLNRLLCPDHVSHNVSHNLISHTILLAEYEAAIATLTNPQQGLSKVILKLLQNRLAYLTSIMVME